MVNTDLFNKNNYVTIPKFCYTEEGKKCKGQLCSDCPNKNNVNKR